MLAVTEPEIAMVCSTVENAIMYRATEKAPESGKEDFLQIAQTLTAFDEDCRVSYLDSDSCIEAITLAQHADCAIWTETKVVSSTFLFNVKLFVNHSGLIW
jgi:hypothetical protein